MRPVLKRVMPEYPVLARQINVKGNVKLEADVAADGTVRTFTVKGGHPILVDAAETAIRKWKYAPAPRESTELIEIHFDPQ
jgi:TonB family protein